MRSYCRDLIEHKGIYRCKPGEKIPGLHPGSQYSWQYYLRRCLYDARFAHYVGELFWEQADIKASFQLGAVEAAGVPVATAIQAVAFSAGREIPIITFKRSPKAYGLKNYIEGPLNMDLPVLIVDDIASSFLTLKGARAMAVIRGLKVHTTYFTVADKLRVSSSPAEHQLRRSELGKQKLVSLFTSNDFNLSWSEYVQAHGREPEFGPVA